MADATQFYIGGAWAEPQSAARMPVINPATGLRIAEVALAGDADVNRAVACARAAFAEFADTSRAQRLALLHRIIAEYENRMPDIAGAITLELGAPAAFARDSQAWIGLAHLQQAAASLATYEFDRPRGATMVTREPIGVAALITPWNWPMNQIVCKVAPALAAGCTMVLKPSEITPLCAAVFAQIMHDAGVPAGVFNLVHGDGPHAGRALAAHGDVDVVSFTGSTRAGTDVAMAAAPSVKRVLQELGGKSPFIVLPDANLAAAVASCTATCFANSGQSCDAPTRLLVPRVRHAEAVQLACDAASAWIVGDPADPATTMGPLVSQRQFDHVQRLISTGLAEGATLAAGGLGRPTGLAVGFFVRPTLFAGVTPAMTIAREEIFGPVLSIMPYDSEYDAIRIANDTQYGLAAYIHGEDIGQARRVARLLRAGSIYVNDPAFDTAAPFGGYKQSGNGREYADFAFDDFTEIKGIAGYWPKKAN